MNSLQKKWIPRESDSPPPEISDWAASLGISVWLANILWARGLKDFSKIEEFLSPGLRNLIPPLSWLGVSEGAQIISDGLLAGKKLAVWGDYDVDGVTGTAVVKTVLSWHGFDALSFLPHRSHDGYGLNVNGVRALAEQGINILLTVDCGISDLEPVELATELGMEVVISDHHLPGPKLPKANAICNPALPGSPYPSLAGVGMAFYLMARVHKLLEAKTKSGADIRSVLDFVAMGTIADMVPLTGQNRILAKNGLLLLNEAKKPGIAALKSVSGLAPSAGTSAGQVSFSLAPRLNVAGRLDRANESLDLLLAKTPSEAMNIAEKLDAMNKERRSQEDSIFKEALSMVEDYRNDPAFVLYAPHWHGGIIGIVASRIVEAFYKPTLVLCQDGEFIKGSGRSIKELNLYEALTSCSHLLTRYGGHHQAAGLTFQTEKLDEVRQTFNQAVVKAVGDKAIEPTLYYDAEAGFDIASDGTCLSELELLQPFGIKNAEPVFISPPLRIKNISHFGLGNIHAKLNLCDESTNISLQVKAWRKGKEFPLTGIGRQLKIAYNTRLNNYNGVPGIDINLRDWRWLARNN